MRAAGTTLVVGAGPAGAAAAAAAARRGEHCVLAGHPRDHPAGTIEVLSGRAAADLAALGWYDAVTERAHPCDAVVSRWGHDVYVERPALLEPGGLGWIVDRAWFDPLLRGLATRDGVARVAAAAQAPPGGRRIVATGKHTPTDGSRRVLGPDLIALTAALPAGTVDGLAGRLLVEADSAGWWSAVDDGRHTAVTFTTDASSPDEVRQAWRRAVAARPGWLPGTAAAAVPRVRPVRSRLHSASVSADPVRVGDAALSVDPLSGHGLALSLAGALRCATPGYPVWLREQADVHEAAGRAAYAAVAHASPFWRRLAAGDTCGPAR